MTPSEREGAVVTRVADYAEHVRVWNEACLETVGRYFEHKTWIMRKRPTYEAVHSKIPASVFYLRQEVTQKIDRLEDLQRELEARLGRV